MSAISPERSRPSPTTAICAANYLEGAWCKRPSFRPTDTGNGCGPSMPRWFDWLAGLPRVNCAGEGAGVAKRDPIARDDAAGPQAIFQPFRDQGGGTFRRDAPNGRDADLSSNQSDRLL